MNQFTEEKQVTREVLQQRQRFAFTYQNIAPENPKTRIWTSQGVLCGCGKGNATGSEINQGDVEGPYKKAKAGAFLPDLNWKVQVWQQNLELQELFLLLLNRHLLA